jgi:predicted small secreted protein
VQGAQTRLCASLNHMKTMTTLLKRTAVLAGLLGVTLMLMGCHTAHGFGQDVENAGEKIQEKTQ